MFAVGSCFLLRNKVALEIFQGISLDGERGEIAKNLRASPFNGDPNDATFSQIHLNGH